MDRRAVHTLLDFVLYTLGILDDLNDQGMPQDVPSDLPSTMVDEPPTSRRRGRRRNKGPKPWFVLKLSIAVAAAIIAYAGYVYIGRLCIPMIKRERDALGSRRLGSESQCLLPPVPSLLLLIVVLIPR